MASTTTIKRYNSSGVFEDVKVWYYTSEGKVPVSSVKRWNGSIWEQVSKTPITFEYNGTYTQSEVTISGVVHDLYTLTKSGTLTLGKDAKYWVCGGGGNGGTKAIASVSYGLDGSGNGGGGGYIKNGTLTAGTHVITVGSGNGGASKIGSISANGGQSGADGGAGGSGGGGGGGYSSDYRLTGAPGGAGAGINTYPFGLTSKYAHCAGGAGGPYYYNDGGSIKGGAGGSKGASGSNGATWGWDYDGTYQMMAYGGDRGGGNSGWVNYPSGGVNATRGDGSPGSFYGAGGGGGFYKSDINKATGGSGYQGVVYIAIPKS